MVHTLFYSRFRSDMDADTAAAYRADARRLRALAEENTGFVSQKTYTAEDGERLTVVVFDSPEAQRAWRGHSGHVEVQRRGRERYYAEYRIVVAEEVRTREWSCEGS